MEKMLLDIIDACNFVSRHTNSRNIQRINTIRNNIIAFLLVLEGDLYDDILLPL